eukprot:UN27321
MELWQVNIYFSLFWKVPQKFLAFIKQFVTAQKTVFSFNLSVGFTLSISSKVISNFISQESPTSAPVGTTFIGLFAQNKMQFFFRIVCSSYHQ